MPTRREVLKSLIAAPLAIVALPAASAEHPLRDQDIDKLRVFLNGMLAEYEPLPKCPGCGEFITLQSEPQESFRRVPPGSENTRASDQIWFDRMFPVAKCETCHKSDSFTIRLKVSAEVFRAT